MWSFQVTALLKPTPKKKNPLWSCWKFAAALWAKPLGFCEAFQCLLFKTVLIKKFSFSSNQKDILSGLEGFLWAWRLWGKIWQYYSDNGFQPSWPGSGFSPGSAEPGFGRAWPECVLWAQRGQIKNDVLEGLWFLLCLRQHRKITDLLFYLCVNPSQFLLQRPFTAELLKQRWEVFFWGQDCILQWKIHLSPRLWELSVLVWGFAGLP